MCSNPPVFFLHPRSFISWSKSFTAHAPVNWIQVKKSQQKAMKTPEFRFLRVELRRDPHLLFSTGNIHSHSSAKTASYHELSKFSYLKPIQWVRKVDFEKLSPIHSTHISADAPIHAESESVLAFDEKCLARPIINDSRPKISILGFFTKGIRKRSTTGFSRLLFVYQPLRIFSILPFLQTLVERLRRTYHSELQANLKNS